MKAVVGAALTFLLWTTLALAQQVLPPGPSISGAIACAYNTSPPTVSTGQWVLTQCDSQGRLLTTVGSGIVTVAPYAYTPLTPGQHGLSITTATALTVPTTATYATICASGAAVEYTTDGTTTPTSSVGQPLASGSCVALSGPTVLANFKAIQKIATATLDVEYFK
jgi:hypothetical protein